MYRLSAPAAALALLLALAPPAAARECLDCHEFAAISPGGTVVHAPFGEKDCGSCHADHGDEERLVLTEQGNALCEQCHGFAEAAFLAAHRKIAPTGKAACTGCHDPHRAPGRRLLRAGLHEPVKSGACEKCHRSDGRLLLQVNRGLCFVCHQRAAFTRPVVHDPVKKSLCLDCHDPHGAASVRLLRGGYSLEREVRAGGKEYAFCLACHDRVRLLGEAGKDSTRFAEGARNLHSLHVLPQGKSSERAAGERALTCRNCHEAHSATTAALTRTELDCGASLCMKMEFRRGEEGGECMASCHGERVKYRRGTPAAAPNAPPKP
jgi:predicted CXXCH cytochrome family protein